MQLYTMPPNAQRDLRELGKKVVGRTTLDAVIPISIIWAGAIRRLTLQRSRRRKALRCRGRQKKRREPSTHLIS